MSVLTVFAVVAVLAAPVVHADDGTITEQGQSVGGAGIGKESAFKPKPFSVGAPRFNVPGSSGFPGSRDVRGGASAAAEGGRSADANPKGLTVYRSMDYPTFASIPHKGGHPHFVFDKVGDGVAIRFTGANGGAWVVSEGSDGMSCNARLWVSESPGGKPLAPFCEDESPYGAPASNILTVEYSSRSKSDFCLLRPGQAYYVNMTVRSKWGYCSLYLDPMGGVR